MASCSSSAQPRGRGWWGCSEKAGTELTGTSQSHLNLTGFGSAWATGRSGPHRMWISRGREVSAFTWHPPFLFLASVLSLCSLRPYMLISAHGHARAHTSHTLPSIHAPVLSHTRTCECSHAHMCTSMHTNTCGSNMLFISSFLTSKNENSLIYAPFRIIPNSPIISFFLFPSNSPSF